MGLARETGFILLGNHRKYGPCYNLGGAATKEEVWRYA